MKALIIFFSAVILSALVYPISFNNGINFLNGKTGMGIPHIANIPFRLGLDLLGGTHLVYEADLTQAENKGDAMAGVRDVIERRVNLFGVSEPIVQVEGVNRLVVELAGIRDVKEAIKLIGETPFLQFLEECLPSEPTVDKGGSCIALDDNFFLKLTELTGRHIVKAQVVFPSGVANIGPEVELQFNDEGADLFEKITERNINKRVAILLDGQPISIPVVQQIIRGGKATISGNFTVKEAKELATRLNAGALPVPIQLVSQQTIGASLGKDSLDRSLKAGVYGILLVALFMILFYRLPGLVSVYALLVYMVIVLAIYKFLPVTLTLAGISGFILSLGIAVDANILIFARMKEEMAQGKPLVASSTEGFRRAWFSIRDSHITTLLGALVLYLFSTSIVKGFALTLGIGVAVSLFTATVVTRQNLKFFLGPKFESKRWLFR